MRARQASGCVLLVAIVHACGGGSTTPLSSGSSSGGGSSGAGSDDGGGPAADSSTTSSGGSSSGSGSGSGSGGPGSDGGKTGDGGSSPGKDSGSPVTYPPLAFSAIGQAVQISGQFYFTEGPVWDPSKNVLYFTDINAQQNGTTGGAIYRLTLPNTIDAFLQPAGSADGLGLDPQGNIIAAGFVSRNVWRLSGSNVMQTLAPCSGGGTCYMGQKVNTPDDITARSDGVIYFTDPTFGSNNQGFPAQSLPLGFQGVYRLTNDGVVHVEDKTTSGPNGVNLSPDEKTLYVSYTLGNQVSKFAVASDGSLGNKTTFASANLADSMCVDAGGNVYVGTSGGLAVFNPAGQALGTISVGGQITTNCAFGGPDQKTLFITSHAQSTILGAPAKGTSSLYKVDNMPVPGIRGQN